MDQYGDYNAGQLDDERFCLDEKEVLESRCMKRTYILSDQTLGLRLPLEDQELIKGIFISIFISNPGIENRIRKTDPTHA